MILSGHVRPTAIVVAMPARITDDHREEKYVAKAGGGDCWLWIGAVNGVGYGVFRADYKMHYAHRWMYERYRGPIDDGLDIDHLCRVRHCVRPTHLEAVTRKVNLNRGSGRGGALA